MIGSKKLIIFLIVLLVLLFCVRISAGESGLQYSNIRDRNHQPEKVMDVVGVKTGMEIGEVGAGHGYFTFHLSRRVGESGKIYANDISSGALASIRRQCEREGIHNIETILGEVEDPLLPKGILDMVFIVNAFHDLAKPVELLDNLLPSLKPGAVVVIIDRDPAKFRDPGGHFLTKEKVLEKIEESRFELDRVETFLPQHSIYIIKVGKSLQYRDRRPRTLGRVFSPIRILNATPSSLLSAAAELCSINQNPWNFNYVNPNPTFFVKSCSIHPRRLTSSDSLEERLGKAGLGWVGILRYRSNPS